MARAVNIVWNFCGETQEHARRWGKRWPSAYDLMKLAAGCTDELGLPSRTVEQVCRQFAESRRAACRRPRWRSRESLGWVPFSHADEVIRLCVDGVIFRGERYRLWLSRPIPPDMRDGSFSRDARGHWYLNLQCEVSEIASNATGEIGIDLGLKDLAVTSAGEVIENPRHLRKRAAALARVQRAGRKRQARAIHAKIKNARRHYLHEVSTRLARENRLIVVGDVSSSQLAQTRMAKSVLDAGWYDFKRMLRYKTAIRRGAFIEADERWSSQLCSACGCLPASRPRGIAQLGVRSWTCSDCGTVHDRDHNAALNILASGRNAALQLTEARA